MKKSVLFLTDSLGCGGSEQSLVSLLSTLDYSKINVDLWIRQRGGVFEKFLPKDVNIVEFEPSPKNGFLYWLSNRLYSLDIRRNKNKIHLAELLWKRTEKQLGMLPKHYDIAISFQQGYPTFYLAEKVNADKKVTRVNIDLVHANYSEEFCRNFYDKCDYVIAISEALNEQLKNTNYLSDKSKIKTIFNVFSVDFIRKMAEDEGFQEPFEGMRIVTTGRLVRQKGYHLAIDAASILRDKGLNFKWYFIGEGEKEEELRQQIEDNNLQDKVVLLGLQPNPYPFMKQCDIYVQTSLFEGFGRTVTEAKILGCPIVSTDFPSVFDQIVDGENGLICKMNADDIAEKILLLAGDSDLRNKISDAVRGEQYTTALTESKKFMDLMLS